MVVEEASNEYQLEELECYKLAGQLRKEVSRLCKALPRDDVYRLKDQVIRSSRSVTANIAEGYGRHHHQENIQFCRMARGSLAETLDHLLVAVDEKYIDDDEYTAMRELQETAVKVLNGYIAYLKRCITEGVPQF
jgi:four helix bundle protein